MNVKVNGRPVSLVSTRLFRVSRGSGAHPFFLASRYWCCRREGPPRRAQVQRAL
jgi:hypothetical protein